MSSSAWEGGLSAGDFVDLIAFVRTNEFSLLAV